jgi:S-adenosylmethionine decarboxylase
LLDDIDYIKEAMVGAANEAGANIVGESFHKFSPRGVTGIVAIAESHLCIHTWPEHGYAALDIFTCGSTFKPQKAAQLIIDRLHCRRPEITEIRRGPTATPAAAAL